MEKMALIYGLRLIDRGEVAAVEHGQVLLEDGTTRQVTLHSLEGTRDEIRNQLLQSIDAFFEIHS
jgi:hypothetical protein